MYSRLMVLSVGVVLGFVLGCSSGQKQFQPGPSSSPAAPAAEGKPSDTGITARATEGPESSEAEIIVQLRRDRADYKRILQVLKRWYLEHGLHERATWADKELGDLSKVRTYPYLQEAKEAQPTELGKVDEARSASLQSIDLQNFSEADWVEQLCQVRTNYRMILQNLVQRYQESGDTRRAGWAKKEMDDLNQVRQYAYLVEVDIQNTNLTPKDSIVEADKLFDEARRLHKGALFLPFLNNDRQLKQALDKYVDVIKRYPTSDKIDDAAYYAGEISKEYFNDDIQAIRFYEMAMKWNPKTPHKVRFQCAVIYDFRLHDRARAMALYQQVLTEEKDIDQTNTTFAATRLRQLLEQKGETATSPEGTPSVSSAP